MNLICFSHLRWNFVYQRPQHLISRFVKDLTTYYVEECVFDQADDGYNLGQSKEGVQVVVPHLKSENGPGDHASRMKAVLDKFFEDQSITGYIFWYYTPMAMSFTHHLRPELVVYDCMDELSAFKFAPPELKTNEAMLLSSADIVFTGGNALYDVKKQFHNNVYAMPSSIDKNHFSIARSNLHEPADQKEIPHPRLGFFGVIDERLDVQLIADVASAMPGWHFVIIGPVVKIDPDTLPTLSNIHFLGGKKYDELPTYLSGWDVALIPFAINESTEFISPTKTPEYLAGGVPVVSTPIQDVVNPYGTMGLVSIATTAPEFITKIRFELANKTRKDWLERVDSYLKDISWDNTWRSMDTIIRKEMEKKENLVPQTTAICTTI